MRDGVGEQCGSVFQDSLGWGDEGGGGEGGGGEGAGRGDDGELGGGRGFGRDGELGGGREGAVVSPDVLHARGHVVCSGDGHRQPGPEHHAAQDHVRSAHAHAQQVARVECAVQYARHLLAYHGDVDAGRRRRLALALPLLLRLGRIRGALLGRDSVFCCSSRG